MDTKNVHAEVLTDQTSRVQVLVLIGEHSSCLCICVVVLKRLYVCIETIPDGARYPFCRARHHWFVMGKKEPQSEDLCRDVIQRVGMFTFGFSASLLDGSG
jgi:hypothetical protein